MGFLGKKDKGQDQQKRYNSDKQNDGKAKVGMREGEASTTMQEGRNALEADNAEGKFRLSASAMHEANDLTLRNPETGQTLFDSKTSAIDSFSGNVVNLDGATSVEVSGDTADPKALTDKVRDKVNKSRSAVFNHRPVEHRKFEAEVLDMVEQASFAIGLRKLDGSYNGPCVEVENVDGERTFIGFYEDDLDWLALRKHTRGLEGYVTKIFDQSGKGFVLTQDTISHCPLIDPEIKALVFNNNQYMQGMLDPIVDEVTVHTYAQFSLATQNSADYDYVYQYGIRVTSEMFSLSRHDGNNGSVYYAFDGDTPRTGPQITGQEWHTFTQQFINGSFTHHLLLDGEPIWTNAYNNFGNISRVFNLGAYSADGSTDFRNFLTGYVRELLIYPRISENEERMLMRDESINYWDNVVEEVPTFRETISQAVAGFSLRRVNPEYTGPCVRVKLITGQEYDLGFGSDQLLDYTRFSALLAEHSATEGRITRWYDQMDPDNFISQPTYVAMPLLDVANKKAYFAGEQWLDGHLTALDSAASIVTSLDFELQEQNLDSGYVYWLSQRAVHGLSMARRQDNAGAPENSYYYFTGTEVAYGPTLPKGNRVFAQVLKGTTPTAHVIYENERVLDAASTDSILPFGQLTSDFVLGASDAKTYGVEGHLDEFLVFNRVLTQTQVQVLSIPLNKTYRIYPVLEMGQLGFTETLEIGNPSTDLLPATYPNSNSFTFEIFSNDTLLDTLTGPGSIGTATLYDFEQLDINTPFEVQIKAHQTVEDSGFGGRRKFLVPGTVPYDPLLLTPILWLDPADATNVTISNNAYAGLTNKSTAAASANDAVQTNPAIQFPVQEMGHLTYARSVWSDATDQYPSLQVANSSNLETNELTILLAYRADSIQVSGGGIAMGSVNGANGTYAWKIDFTGIAVEFTIYGNSTHRTVSNPVPDTELHIYAFTLDDTYVRFWRDGESVTEYTRNIAAIDFSGGYDLQIGANADGTSGFNGMLGDLIIFPRALHSDSISYLLNGLMTKHSIGQYIDIMPYAPAMWLDPADDDQLHINHYLGNRYPRSIFDKSKNMELGEELLTDALYTPEFWTYRYDSNWTARDESILSDGTLGTGALRAYNFWETNETYYTAARVELTAGYFYLPYSGWGAEIKNTKVPGFFSRYVTIRSTALTMYSLNFEGRVTDVSIRKVAGLHGFNTDTSSLKFTRHLFYRSLGHHGAVNGTPIRYMQTLPDAELEQQEFTLMAVIRMDDRTATNGAISIGQPYATAADAAVRLEFDNSTMTASISDGTSLVQKAAEISEEGVHVYGMRVSASEVATLIDGEVTQDSYGGPTARAGLQINYQNNDGFYFGAFPGELNGLSGHFGDLLYFPRALDTVEMQSIAKGLLAKYYLTWADLMVESYRSIHNHAYDKYKDASYEALELALQPGGYFYETFGPHGQNKTTCDFLYMFELETGVLTGDVNTTMLKTSGELRWEVQSMVYTGSNDPPQHNGTNNSGIAIVSSETGFADVTRFDILKQGFAGPLPWFNLPACTIFRCGGNAFTGTFPEHHFPLLTHLYAYENEFDGEFPTLDIPAMTDFRIHQNDFTGTLPVMPMPNLRMFRIDKNDFSGDLSSYTSGTSLEHFNNSRNSYTGDYPVISAPNIISINGSEQDITGWTSQVPAMSLVTLDFIDATLSTAAVDDILATLAADAATRPTMRIDLSTTNAAPSSTGIQNALILLGAGHDVTINADWEYRMLADYLSRNSHIHYTQTVQDELLARLSSGYLYNTFGPSGQNKTECDFVHVFEYTGDIFFTVSNSDRANHPLHWNFDGTELTQATDILPTQSLGANGIITVSHTNDWNNVTGFAGETATLTGHLPKMNMPNADNLTFVNTNMTGTIPTMTAPGLRWFYIYNNQFTGLQEQNLPNCRTFRIYDQNISGDLPTLTLPMVDALQYDRNPISGDIGNLVVDYPLLRSFTAHNTLMSSVADQNLPELTTFWVYNMVNMTGPAPNIIAPKMVSFLMFQNYFGGAMPNYDFPLCTDFRAHRNDFTSIPALNLPAAIKFFIQDQNCSSPCPTFTLPAATLFYIRNCGFTGTVPAFNLPDLIIADISNNSFTGFQGMSIASSATTFDAHDNNLDAAAVDQVLADLAVNASTRTILTADLTGTNAAPTSAADNSLFALAENGHTVQTNAEWQYQMAVDYLYRNSHGTYAQSSKDELLTKLTSGYLYDTFGPTGQNKTSCDFLYLFELAGDSLAGPSTSKMNKTSGTLRWDIEGTVTLLNDVPDHGPAQNLNSSGVAILSSETGFADMTLFEINDQGFGGPFPKVDLPGTSTLRFGANAFTGRMPEISLPTAHSLYGYGNNLDQDFPAMDLPNVTDFRFQYNSFTGNLNNVNMPLVEIVRTDRNQMSGDLSYFSNLANLRLLNVRENLHTGNIPVFVSTDLYHLDAASNVGLTGYATQTLSAAFTYIDLQWCTLTQTAIDGILANLAVNASTRPTMWVDLSGTTNAAPSSTGVDDLITLSEAGHTILTNANWEDRMLADYLLRNSHGTYSQTARDEFASRLSSGYLYDTFGPAGQNKTVCDFVYLLEFTTETKRGTLSSAKGGDLLRWDINGTIFTGNAVPDHAVGTDPGICTVSSTDGWNGMIEWHLDTNNFTNVLPNFDMPNLVELRIHVNNFYGNLPEFNTPNLEVIWAYHNEWTGPFPDYQWPKMRYFYFSYCDISGECPNFNFPDCQYFSIHGNNLNGQIPLFNFPKLITFTCYLNPLTSTLPAYDFPLCTYFMIRGGGFSGEIPAALNLPSVITFDIHNNAFTGSFPELDLRNAQIFRIQENQFSGDFPALEIPKVTEFNISTNLFTGVFPRLKMPNLVTATGYTNDFTGYVSSDLASTITSFSFQNNEFTAEAADQILADFTVDADTRATASINISGVATSLPSYASGPDYYALINAGHTVITNMSWTDKMVRSYVHLHQHATWSTTALDELAFRLGNGQYLETTFGPSGQNKTACDFVYMLELADSESTVPANSTITKTGTALRWDMERTITAASNDIPAHTHGGNGIITVSSEDGWTGVTYFQLFSTNLTGPLPNFNFPNTTDLRLHYNTFSGSIPPLNLPALQDLYLNHNDLSGPLPDPADWNTPALIQLVINNNSLSGEFQVYNWPVVQDFGIQFNQFTGIFPTYDSSPTLRSVNLYNNEFTGMADQNLPDVYALRAYYNKMSGPFPNLTLPAIQWINMGGNQFTGPAPVFTSTILKQYSFGINHFSGTFPNLNAPDLENLVLGQNHFHGDLPDLTGYPDLIALNAEDNNFTGYPDMTPPANLYNFRVYGNNLNTPAINKTLADFRAALPNRTPGNQLLLNMDQDGMAAPTGQGIRDMQYLDTIGHTMTFNTHPDFNQYGPLVWVDPSDPESSVTYDDNGTTMVEKAVNVAYGTNLLDTTNGLLTDWTNGAPDHWTVNGTDVNNTITESSGAVHMVSDGTSSPSISQNVLTVGTYYKLEYRIQPVNAGSMRIGTEASADYDEILAESSDWWDKTIYFVAQGTELRFSTAKNTASDFVLDTIKLYARSSHQFETESVANRAEMGTLNGLDAFRSNDATQMKILRDPAFEANELTAFYLAKRDVASGLDGGMAQGGLHGNQAWQIQTGNNYTRVITVDDDATSHSVGTYFYTDDEAHVFEFRLSDTEEMLYADGNSVNRQARTTGTMRYSSGRHFYILGSYSTQWALDGEMGEAIFFNRDLTDAEALEVTNYLIEKHNLNWAERMLDSYLAIHAHELPSQAAQDELLARLQPGEYLFDTFGPRGQNRTKCDFVYLFEFDGTGATGAVTNSGDTLRWDDGTTVTVDNNHPPHSGTGFKTVSSTDHWVGVTSIYMNNCGYVGALPKLSMPNLTNLQIHDNQFSGTCPDLYLPAINTFIISNNTFTGTCPTFNFPAVTDFRLAGVGFTGDIPLFDFPKVKEFRLENCGFDGSMPAFNFPEVYNFRVDNNKLTGTIQTMNMPKVHWFQLQVNEFTALEPQSFPLCTYFYVHYNKITGSIPDLEIPNVDYAYFYRNEFTGAFPPLKLPKARRIYANYNNLTAMPPANMVDWPEMEYIYFSFNPDLSGNIPLYDCPKLTYINYEDCNMSGEISGLDLDNRYPLMQHFRIDHNSFSGHIPALNWPDLINLRIDNNAFSSMDLQNLPSCTTFHINHNLFTGPCPLHVLPNATQFDAHHNDFSGDLPDFDYPNLQRLQLHGNQFTGTVKFFNCPSLTTYYAHENAFTGMDAMNYPEMVDFRVSSNAITGPLPTLTIPKCELLYLQSNAFTGAISDFDLPECTELYLQNNDFTSLPAAANLNLPKVQTFRFNDNSNLSGSLPNYNLPEITYFSARLCDLSGSIPVLNMPKVQTLNLSDNRFSGTFPTQTMPDMEVFYLQNNEFTGIGYQDFPNCTLFRIYANDMAGNMPAFNLPACEIFYVYNNSFTGDFPSITMPNCTEFLVRNDGFTGALPNPGSSVITRFEAYNCDFDSHTWTSFPTTLDTFIVYGNALPQTAVDDILNKFVTNLSSRPTDLTIQLHNGTNAPPSTAGQADATTITNSGRTVLTS